MRADYHCAVVIRYVQGAFSGASWSPRSRLCGHCAVVQLAFSETLPAAEILLQVRHQVQCSEHDAVAVVQFI